jgi:hypothetical protein
MREGTMTSNQSDRGTLVSFLQNHADRSYRAYELKLETGVPKAIVRELLTGDSRITISEHPKGTFHYQAAIIINTEKTLSRKNSDEM